MYKLPNLPRWSKIFLRTASPQDRWIANPNSLFSLAETAPGTSPSILLVIYCYWDLKVLKIEDLTYRNHNRHLNLFYLPEKSPPARVRVNVWQRRVGTRIIDFNLWNGETILSLSDFYLDLWTNCQIYFGFSWFFCSFSFWNLFQLHGASRCLHKQISSIIPVFLDPTETVCDPGSCQDLLTSDCPIYLSITHHRGVLGDG